MKRKIDGLTENEFDNLTLILGLVEHGWSYRKIGELTNQSHNTVSALYNKALQYKEAGKLTKTASSERDIRIQYVGDSTDLEEIEQAVIDRQHGQIRPRGQLID